MKIKQNLEIIKNISTIDIEFNRRLASIGYQLFSNDREMDENVYNEEIAKFIKSLDNIKKSIASILSNNLSLVIKELNTEINIEKNDDK